MAGQIKTKLENLVNAQAALSLLATGRPVLDPTLGNLSYAVGHLLTLVKPHIKTYMRKRDELEKANAKKDEKGKYGIPVELFLQHKMDLEDFASAEVVIEREPISWAAFEAIDKAKADRAAVERSVESRALEALKSAKDEDEKAKHRASAEAAGARALAIESTILDFNATSELMFAGLLSEPVEAAPVDNLG